MAFMPIWKDGVKMIIKSIMTDEDRKALEYMLSLEYAMPYQLLKTKNNRRKIIYIMTPVLFLLSIGCYFVKSYPMFYVDMGISIIAWNGENYPFEAWNADQTLQSAMASSVNWYFQSVDEQLGASDVYSYIQEIGYGNENMSGDFSSYWMESSLEISPIEQVELLTKLQNNSFGFAPENINAVKDAIRLSSSDTGTLYGKTGTGRVNGQDVNGWFIGYIETADNTYFFATNISADSDATGGNATEITMSILSDMNIWVSQK